MDIKKLFDAANEVRQRAGEMVAAVKEIRSDLREFKRQANLSGVTATPRIQYSKQEAAYMLACSDRWLATLEADYGLRSHKVGNKRFYAHDELVRFVNDQQAAAKENMIFEMVGG